MQMHKDNFTSSSSFAFSKASRAEDKVEASTEVADTVSSSGNVPFEEKSTNVCPRASGEDILRVKDFLYKSYKYSTYYATSGKVSTICLIVLEGQHLDCDISWQRHMPREHICPTSMHIDTFFDLRIALATFKRF